MKFGLRFVSALATGAALLGALPGGVVAQVNIVQPSIPVVIEPSAPNPPEAESRRREAVPATIKFKNDGLFIAYFHGLCQVGGTNTAFDSGNIIKGTVRETSDRFFVGDSVLVTISYANYLGQWKQLDQFRHIMKAGTNCFQTNGTTTPFSSPIWGGC